MVYPSGAEKQQGRAERFGCVLHGGSEVPQWPFSVKLWKIMVWPFDHAKIIEHGLEKFRHKIKYTDLLFAGAGVFYADRAAACV